MVMKRIISVFILCLLAIIAVQSINAQCKGFAKKVCKVELDPFTHDGNFHAAVLTEGEEAELYKTFYSDTEYRIAVCGSEQLPNIEFKIVDADKNVLYSNKDHNFSRTWDFKLQSSQQLKILVKVHPSGVNAENVQSGCVSIMFGFKESK
jgi:hypothetical protein